MRHEESPSGRDLAKRIADSLRRHGPASSRRLAEGFLRLGTPSEAIATEILRPVLEPEGCRYDLSSGWVPTPRISGPLEPAGAEERMVAVAVDRETGKVACAPVDTAVAEPFGKQPGPEEGPRLLDGAVVVVLDRRDAGWLKTWLEMRHLGLPTRIVSFRQALGGGLGIPRRADLDEICGLLGVRRLDSEDVMGAARAMAGCLAESRGHARQDLITWELPPGIPADQIRSLPEAPGIYRFYDDADELIYVGKAANLRRRVTSYFKPRPAGAHGSRFLHRARRLEHEVTGSELEALLAEAREIRRRSPEGNVQVEVHERPARGTGVSAWALLLPRADGRGVTAVVVAGGRYAGRIVIGPRGGGLEAGRRLLGRVLCGSAASGRGDKALRETRILESWLARHGDSVSRLDLDGFVDAAAAARALAAAAKDLLASPDASFYRA